MWSVVVKNSKPGGQFGGIDVGIGTQAIGTAKINVKYEKFTCVVCC